MKISLAISLAALFTVLPLAAQAAGEKDAHAGHGAMHATQEGGLVDGVVKKIDKAAGKVTVAAASGVTVLTNETYKLRKQGSAVTLTKVDANAWDLAGDVELA